jgi:hypothetical protein
MIILYNLLCFQIRCTRKSFIQAKALFPKLCTRLNKMKSSVIDFLFM